MSDTGIAPPQRFPSFSILIETENLANAKIEDLSDSLNSLAYQDLTISSANEVVILDSGDAPSDLLEKLCVAYPWLKVCQIPAGVGYYEAKMLGVSYVTGDIVIYADSDCVYESSWLGNMLSAFTQNPEVKIVAGETSTAVQGYYTLAMAIAYFLPQFSHREKLYVAHHYFLNNVAFRRNFIEKHPIPLELPLYRGNCALHAVTLRKQGYQIWKHPKAKAVHSPPEISFFFWRFLLMGHDSLVRPYLIEQLASNEELQKTKLPRQLWRLRMWLKNDIQALKQKTKIVIANYPQYLVILPLALPVILLSKLLVYIGCTITFFDSDYLLNKYQTSQQSWKSNEFIVKQHHAT